MIIYGRLSHYRLIDAYQKRFSRKYWCYNRREIQIEPEAQQDSNRIFNQNRNLYFGSFLNWTIPIVLKLPPKVEEGKGRKVCVCVFMCFTQVKTPNQKHIVEDQMMIMTYRDLCCMYVAHTFFIINKPQKTFLWSHLIFTKGCDKK